LSRVFNREWTVAGGGPMSLADDARLDENCEPVG